MSLRCNCTEQPDGNREGSRERVESKQYAAKGTQRLLDALASPRIRGQMQLVTKSRFLMACAVAALWDAPLGLAHHLSEVGGSGFSCTESAWKAVVTQDDLPQPEILPLVAHPPRPGAQPPRPELSRASPNIRNRFRRACRPFGHRKSLFSAGHFRKSEPAPASAGHWNGYDERPRRSVDPRRGAPGRRLRRASIGWPA